MVLEHISVRQSQTGRKGPGARGKSPEIHRVGSVCVPGEMVAGAGIYRI